METEPTSHMAWRTGENALGMLTITVLREDKAYCSFKEEIVP